MQEDLSLQPIPVRRGTLLTVCAIIALFAVGAVLLFFIHERSRTVHKLQESTHEMLSHTVVPEFVLRNATLVEAIEELNRRVSECNLSRPIRFELWTKAELPKGFRKSLTSSSPPPIPGLESMLLEPSDAHKQEVRQSVDLADAPLSGILRYVSGIYECVVGEQDTTVYLVQGADNLGSAKMRVFSVRPNFTREMLSAGGATPVRNFFQANGVIFNEGADAFLLPGDNLVVYNVQEQIDLIDAIIPSDCGLSEPGPLERAKLWLLYQWEAIRSGGTAP